jgi:NAD(P)-dependent dehydrogenase (short-subunit alcohol dehydrogenase family)
MTNQFHNATIVVTGGANGIGRETAITFARQGARVIILDINTESGSALALEFPNIEFICIDLENATAIEQWWTSLQKDGITIDILINNVGLSRFKPLLELSTGEWDQILNVNLRAAFVCTRQFAAQHTRGSYGRIINIASTRHLMSEPYGEAYAASKGGLVSLTHALAASLANTGITVNCISPGWIHTGDVSELSESDHKQHFSGRVGQPADIASMCLYLCEPAHDFINGQNIYIDGGMTKKMIYE